MLSRLARRPLGLQIAASSIRCSTSTPATPNDTAVSKKQRNYDYKGVQWVKPGYFGGMLSDFLGERLGVTGCWSLGIGLSLCAFSKEIILLNDETVFLVPQVGMLYLLMSTAAQKLSDHTEMANTNIFNRLYSRKDEVVNILQTGIDAATDVETEVSVRTDVFDVLRSNAAMYRDALYRERVAAVHQEVLKRLQHQAELEAARRRIKQAHMINWIEREVVKEVATKLDNKAVMTACLEELKGAVDDAMKPKAAMA